MNQKNHGSDNYGEIEPLWYKDTDKGKEQKISTLCSALRLRAFVATPFAIGGGFPNPSQYHINLIIKQTTVQTITETQKQF